MSAADEMPDLSSEEDEEWEECEELELDTECLCLFCDDKFPSAEATLQHCGDKHQFNILRMCRKHHLDCISYIKLINYIRTQKPLAAAVSAANNTVPWLSDDFMKPVLEDDPLLLFDIEDYCEVNARKIKCSTDSSVADVRGQGDGCQENGEHQQLLQRLREAEARAEEAEQQLQETLTAMDKMRGAAQKILITSPTEVVPSSEAIQNLREDEDDLYFNSYGHFSIHKEMLQDTVRTESYRDAVYKNKELFKDKVVLDVGCGTGILSMFAANAGARLVIGVDMSDVIYQAMDIVKENKLDDKIKLIKGRMEDLELPVEQVDIIISEWMGYFLLFESMLDTVVWARDHYLSPGGLILPNHCTISLAGLADPSMHQRYVQYWNDVYSFRMTCMKSAVVGEASICIIDSNKLVTTPCVIKDIDIQTCRTKDLEFTSAFSLPVTHSGEITALVGYFDIGFTNLNQKVEFSTGPQATPTHWKQTMFLLEDPITASQGDTLEGQLICRKNVKDPRSLKIYISLRGRKLTYLMQ